MSNTSGKSPTGADVAGGGAGVNAPSPVAGWIGLAAMSAIHDANVRKALEGVQWGDKA